MGLVGCSINSFIDIFLNDIREDPHKVYSRQYSVVEPPERQNVMKVKCCQDMPWCGPSQDYYEHLAYTAFQAFCQKQAETNIQHITPCFDEETVERAVNIGLAAGSDYLSKYHHFYFVNGLSMD